MTGVRDGLVGQAAVVTGGAGGIGAASAERLAADGAHVVVIDIDLAGAEAVANGLREKGMGATAHQTDVTDPDAIHDMVQRVLAERGAVDILVNAAGFPDDHLLVDMDDESWHKVIAVCLYGTFACCRAIAPSMIDNGYGRIVNISSRAYLGNPGQVNYSAAKAGVVGLTKALAKELGRDGITVNAVAPGLIETEAVRQHPRWDAIASRAAKANSIRRLGQPGDVADAIAWLASSGASFVTGDVIHVSGGRFS